MVCAQAILRAQNHTLGGDGCFVCHALYHCSYVIPMSNISAQALCTDHSASDTMRIIVQIMVDGISENNWPLPIVKCLKSNRVACQIQMLIAPRLLAGSILLELAILITT